MRFEEACAARTRSTLLLTGCQSWRGPGRIAIVSALRDVTLRSKITGERDADQEGVAAGASRLQNSDIKTSR
jgi:hypothetical protein